jgi:hypothetical protein
VSTIKVDTVQSSGGGAATLTKQHAAKAWMHLNGDGTIAIQDSFNVSGVTDVNTGSYTQTHTNAMSNALYSAQLTNNRAVTTNNSSIQHIDGTFTSALLNILLVRHDNAANEDSTRVMTSVHGDLA